MSKKSRKLIRSGGNPPSVEVEEVVVEPAPVEDDRTFFFLPDVEPYEVDERDLHDLMKLWRHGRATRTIWQALSDGYIVLFAVVMLGAMIINVVLDAQTGMAGCTAESCQLGRFFLPSAAVVACYSLSLLVSRLFGPVLASAAEGFWLMDAPISRRRLLRQRLTAPVVLAGFVGLVVVALVAALSGMNLLEAGAWAGAAGLGSAALMALAGVEQVRERTGVISALQGVFTAATLAILLGVVSIAAGWLVLATFPMELATNVVIALAGVALVGLVLALVAALRRLEQIRRARLVSAGALVEGMQGAMFALDFGLIRDILVERRMAEKGHVRPTKGRGLGLTALIWRDVERVRRGPRPLIGLALALFVCYATDALRVSQLNPFISGLALLLALVPFLGGLRVLSRTRGLARTMPFKTSQLRTASMAVALVLAMLWGAAAVPAFVGIDAAGADLTVSDGITAAVITAMAGWLGAVRWVTAKKVDFGVPMLATAGGAMPPTLVFNLFRGVDMVALITAPLILQWPAWVSMMLAFIVFVALRGTFDMDAMRAEQEQAQRELRAAKEVRNQPRTKIPRPTR